MGAHAAADQAASWVNAMGQPIGDWTKPGGGSHFQYKVYSPQPKNAEIMDNLFIKSREF